MTQIIEAMPSQPAVTERKTFPSEQAKGWTGTEVLIFLQYVHPHPDWFDIVFIKEIVKVGEKEFVVGEKRMYAGDQVIQTTPFSADVDQIDFTQTRPRFGAQNRTQTEVSEILM